MGLIRKGLHVGTVGAVAPNSKKQRVARQTLVAIQGGTPEEVRRAGGRYEHSLGAMSGKPAAAGSASKTPPAMPPDMESEAELVALRVIREVVTAQYAGTDRTAEIAGVLGPHIEKYADDNAGIASVLLSLAQFAGTGWALVLRQRLSGRHPTQEEILADLERYELARLAQH